MFNMKRFAKIARTAFVLLLFFGCPAFSQTVLPVLTNSWELAWLRIVDKDTNGFFLNANETFLKSLKPGFFQSPAELAGKTDFDFYPSNLAGEYRLEDSQVRDSGNDSETIELRQTIGGVPVQVLNLRTVIRDSAGHIFAVRNSFYPVPTPEQTTLPEFGTEWLRANAISIDKDTNSIFLNANENFLATLRPTFPNIKTVTNLIGRDDFYFYPAELAEKFRADDRRVMSRGIAFETIEDNQPIGAARTSFQVTKRPLRNVDGTLYGLRILAWQIPQIMARRMSSSLELNHPRSAEGFAMQRTFSLPNIDGWENIPSSTTNNDSVSTVVSSAGTESYFRMTHHEPSPESWVPERPITLVVPFPAGGSTDQLARLLARILEPKLGQKIYVVTLPGSSGSVGTAAVLTAPRDGYTWRAGLAADLGLYQILGLLDTKISDWNCFLPVSHAQIFSVGAQSPYKTFDQLLAGFRASPGTLRVGSSGPASTGVIAMRLLAEKTGITFSNVFFNGGAEVAAACAAGQIDAMAQTFTDSAALMRSGQVLPLATLSPRPLVIEGLPELIPPVGRWVPDLVSSGNYFGFFLPRGTPSNVLRTLQKIWHEVIPNSPEVRSYALGNGAEFSPVTGALAQEEVLKYLRPAAWGLYDAGLTLFSPEAVGIPRP